MKKVLMISCNGLGNGGVQHVMMNIVRNLSSEFHFDMLVFTNEVCHFDAEFQKYGNIFRLPRYTGKSKIRRKLNYYFRFPSLYFSVKKILRENGPYDIIHCHNYFEAAPCLMAAAHSGVPVRVSHCHSVFARGVDVIREFLNSTIYKPLLNRYATGKIGCSQAAADYLFGSNTHALSIPNAIDLKRFNRALYPQGKTKHSFVHVGSFGIIKNQLFILDVFGKIQQKWPDATLKLIGNKNEEYERLMHQKIDDLKLKNVELLPHDSDVPALFAQSEYMIFPSLYEGLPLSVLEAQSMGVRCFVSDTVTREADIGLCQYLSLKQPAQGWAQAVFDTEDRPVPQPNTEKASLEHYIQQIRQVYEGIK